MLLILITLLSPSPLVAKSNRPKNVQGKVYCYKKADFTGLRETLHHIPWESVISDCPFEDCLTRFQDILFSAINQFIPQVTLRRGSRPPWISNEIMKLIRSPDLFLTFKEMRKITKEHMHLSCIQIARRQNSPSTTCSPFPARGVIILVSRRPELSAILNCPAGGNLNGLGPHFRSLKYQFYGAWWLCVASWRCFSGFMV